MKKIFLISGEAQHGKDSTADILKNRLDGESIKLSFAKYLKIICKDYFGWDEMKDEKGRRLLQQVGTEFIRHELNMPLFHCKRICEDIEIIEDYYDYIFIPDLRFRDELHYTKAMFPNNVITIRVHRVGFDNGLTLEQKNHESEVDLKNYPHDYHIYVQSGIEHLEDEIDRTFKGVLW